VNLTCVDLRSDTVTRPTAAMRRAMAEAEVGDDVYGEDPSVERLQAVAAERLGMEAALFVPSGTMANQLAIRSHTEPGDALLVGRDAHAYLYEGGAAAALSGVHSVVIGEHGHFTAEDVRAAIYPDDVHFARTRLVCLENTHNRSGGSVFPLAAQRAIATVAQSTGLRMHLDGARLFNAACATRQPVDTLAAPFDSVAFCLSKGLGAPVGSLLCGPRDWILRAKRFRKAFGGGMRQAGILAAAGLFALEHHVDRLADDHAQAALLADGLARLDSVERVVAPETNIVVFEVADAPSWVERARKAGVWLNALDACRVRAVTHLEVEEADVKRALERLREVGR